MSPSARSTAGRPRPVPGLLGAVLWAAVPGEGPPAQPAGCSAGLAALGPPGTATPTAGQAGGLAPPLVDPKLARSETPRGQGASPLTAPTPPQAPASWGPRAHSLGGPRSGPRPQPRSQDRASGGQRVRTGVAGTPAPWDFVPAEQCPRPVPENSCPSPRAQGPLPPPRHTRPPRTGPARACGSSSHPTGNSSPSGPTVDAPCCPHRLGT